jgi:signal transduction histidine kinase
MRWYQHLFWRIFGGVWLVSTLGILISLTLFISVTDTPDRTESQKQKATIIAEQLISDYQYGVQRKEQRRRLPLWIYEKRTNSLIYSSGRRQQPVDAMVTEIIAPDGTPYLVYFPPERNEELFERMWGFLLSFQVLWVIAVSFGSSLLVTWLVVRPINDLKGFVRRLHQQGNLSSRAEGQLVNRGDELGQLAREFNQMVDYVEKTLDSQRHLLQDVSHELRAPLARLQAAAGLAEQKWGEDDRTLQRINKECDKLDGLISEILTLARARDAEATAPVVNVAQLCKDLVQDARISGPKHQFDLSLDVADGVNIRSEPLSRVVSNLLNNAINHTPEGTAIKVTVATANNSLNIRVVDNGPGIPDSIIDSIGQPFRRGANSSGYGLGLSIVVRATERVGGVVQFENLVPTGLRVDIKMPLVN